MKQQIHKGAPEFNEAEQMDQRKQSMMRKNTTLDLVEYLSSSYEIIKMTLQVNEQNLPLSSRREEEGGGEDIPVIYEEMI